MSIQQCGNGILCRIDDCILRVFIYTHATTRAASVAEWTTWDRLICSPKHSTIAFFAKAKNVTISTIKFAAALSGNQPQMMRKWIQAVIVCPILFKEEMQGAAFTDFIYVKRKQKNYLYILFDLKASPLLLSQASSISPDQNIGWALQKYRDRQCQKSILVGYVSNVNWVD